MRTSLRMNREMTCTSPQRARRWRTPWPLLAALLILPRAALALSFTPTEAEWYKWPEYCQARYMVSAAGVDSSFAGRVHADVVKSWESKLGPEVWYSLHHYCAGMLIADRAKVTPDKRERANLLTRVIEEYHFMLVRLPAAHPMRAEVAAHMGLVYADAGQPELALQHLDMAIEGCPSCGVGYEAKAMFYRGRGQLTDARHVLEEGDTAMGGSSAQIHYFLGLVLVDLKEYSAASDQARRAYELGYPLPGLRDRLARAGYPLQ